MKNDYFVYKTHIDFIIVSNEVSPDLITNELNIHPTRFFRKGDKSISKHSGSVTVKPHNLWSLQSISSELIEEKISHHISYLKTILSSKVDILKKYKSNPNLEISFWIWIETDNSGIGLNLDSDEMDFLNSISNKIHFSFIGNVPN